MKLHQLPARRALALLAACLLPSLAAATTWWVDDDGGAGIDFTDIQSAIDVASTGDTIFVHPGTYPGFVLDLGLTIVSAPTQPRAVVTSLVTVTGVAAPHRAVVSGLQLLELDVTSCSTTVVLDKLDITPALASGQGLLIAQCSDVRLYECDVDAASADSDGLSACLLSNSRVEAVRSRFVGVSGGDTDCSFDGTDGGTAVEYTNGSRLTFFLSDAIGGRGGDTADFCEWTQPFAGSGGDGLSGDSSSELWVAGLPNNTIEGGREGYGSWFPCLCFDGVPGWGIDAQNPSAFARYSGATISSVHGPAAEQVPADASLGAYGTHQPGRQLSFKVSGQPGANAFLYLGRDPLLSVIAGYDMEQMTTRLRGYNLGAIPASGEKTFVFTLPSWLPIGFSFFAQAEVTLAGGGSEMTNSLPIVVRHLP